MLLYCLIHSEVDYNAQVFMLLISSNSSKSCKGSLSLMHKLCKTEVARLLLHIQLLFSFLTPDMGIFFSIYQINVSLCFYFKLGLYYTCVVEVFVDFPLRSISKLCMGMPHLQQECKGKIHCFQIWLLLRNH